MATRSGRCSTNSGRLLQESRIRPRVLESALTARGSRRNSFERRSSTLDGIFGRFAALAERIEERFDEDAERIGRHYGQTALVAGGQVGLVHFGDELLDGIHQHAGRHIPEVGHACTVIPAGRHSSKQQKMTVVIRVRVPLDLHAVATDGSAAFALATPLRVRELIALAVREAIGARAPHDKFLRSMRRAARRLSQGRLYRRRRRSPNSPTPMRS